MLHKYFLCFVSHLQLHVSLTKLFYGLICLPKVNSVAHTGLHQRINLFKHHQLELSLRLRHNYVHAHIHVMPRQFCGPSEHQDEKCSIFGCWY